MISLVKDTTAVIVKRILVDHLGVDAGKVTMDAFLRDDLGCDSLDFVELAMALELEFEIERLDEQALKNGGFTVSALVLYIERAIARQGKQPPASEMDPWFIPRVTETKRRWWKFW